MNPSALPLVTAGVLLLGACGPTGGKRIASEAALESIEDFQRFRRADTALWARIETARRAGDNSRAADAQITVDLDKCAETIFLVAKYNALIGLERSRSELAVEKESPVKYCIDQLRAHMR